MIKCVQNTQHPFLYLRIALKKSIVLSFSNYLGKHLKVAIVGYSLVLMILNEGDFFT